jgi:hypothetical protein
MCSSATWTASRRLAGLQKRFVRYRLYPAGEEGRRLRAQAFLTEVQKAFASGGLFRYRVELPYLKVRDLLRQWPRDVVVLDGGGAELLIGNALYLALVCAGDRLEPAPLGAATHVALPLAPTILAVLGPRLPAALSVDHLVERTNEFQVDATGQFVYHRPSADVRGLIAARSAVGSVGGS